MSLPRLLINYSSTVIPILLAVPAIMLIAASKDAAFKSGIFISAISWILALEIVATLFLFVGNKLVTKMKDFSSKNRYLSVQRYELFLILQ